MNACLYPGCPVFVYGSNASCDGYVILFKYKGEEKVKLINNQTQLQYLNDDQIQRLNYSVNAQMAPHVLIYIVFRYASAIGFYWLGESRCPSHPGCLLFMKICGTQLLKDLLCMCACLFRDFPLYSSSLFALLECGCMLVAKHKAHGFNTALKINLCTSSPH